MSSEIGVAPRINAGMLSLFAGNRVCVVGKVVNQEGSQAQIQCSDNGTVTVSMTPGQHYRSQFVEVVGIASADGSTQVREERSCELGDNFDLSNYEQLVQFANGKFKPLFSA
eukprot:CAMPEP_0118987220 /NCGR_PEP_ID=MMETSP1173-20130426/43738_1 /TAXON_ID=1034831 /ORGANISM="Rhizochromulina marina cf, Strain CCMP1243" /LENGTH=111 /DNA_ID=CAMNT_0006938053 /DNA_START=20 /DNA_END=355 /DNA_ORIENTATION=+